MKLVMMKDIAAMADVKPATVRQWKRRGHLPESITVRCFGSTVHAWPKSEIDEWLPSFLSARKNRGRSKPATESTWWDT